MNSYSKYAFNPNTICKLIPDNLEGKNILFIGNIVNLLGYFNLDTKSLSIYESSDYSIQCCANLFNGTNHIFAFCSEEGYNYFTNISNYIGKKIVSIPRNKDKKDFIWNIDTIDMISDKKQKKQAEDNAISEFQKFLGIIKKNNMEFDLIIANPPYSIGNKIITEAISLLSNNGKASVLMPLSQYKGNLYKHINSFELKTQKLFDADTQSNLCICSLFKQECNNKDYHDFILEDNPMKLAYIYSRNKPKQYFMKPQYKVTIDQLDRDLDFIDSSLIYNANKGGGYFAKGGCGYVWNTFGDLNSKKWINKIGVIHFPTKKAKDNFCKYAYNYSEDKYKCLASKLICNVYISEASEEYYYSIPQIDWSNIHINQKELWDKCDYDNAVLAEMGLKYDENGNIIRR